ncbi:UbiD family decarboxylase [Paenibacillus thalictri]|uniref:UbiD family decarboxylase n=1 Tax=Paenibacillus thalictri TaxID=2527873 RepID=A0A4Q9DIJ3_9BACL|nr:UbiD family decarboxylase [Paenibacillus thalictri]TBL71525.1 UbiD family decarboxylase [Paenibacillus thalictri]
MTHPDLRSFLELLKQEHELQVVSAPVDPNLELAEIHRRVIGEQGPSLLFTNVKGSKFPVVANLFGTSRRVDLAFGARPEQLVRQMVEAMNTLIPPTPKALWNERNMLMDLLKAGTKQVPQPAAPVLQVCNTSAPLRGMPNLVSRQEDGGPFVTLPLVYTEHPDTGRHHLGMHRMQVFDERTAGMHWQLHKGGGFRYDEAARRNTALPVTVFLGGPPALTASAVASVPEHLPKLLLASLLLGSKLPLADNPNGGHRLVAEAEFAICGSVQPSLRHPERSFGDRYGSFLSHDFPVFQIDCVWHRKDAIYPAAIVGEPKQENDYLSEFLQRLLSPAVPLVMPGVKSLWTYTETGFHALAAAAVRESYQGEALTLAFRILGESQLTQTKFLMLTDQPVDLEHFPQLLETVLERFDPAKDLIIFNNTPQDTPDHTGSRPNHGSKAVLLGLGAPIRHLLTQYSGGQLPGITNVVVYSRGCLMVQGASYEKDPGLAERLLEGTGTKLSPWPLVVLVDDAAAAVQNQTSFLRTVFTRFHPAADMYSNAKVRRHHITYEIPLIVDARMKPGDPDELFPREDIVRLVDRRWNEYFA